MHAMRYEITPRTPGDRHQVLHLSQPERAGLPCGRQW